MSRIGKQPVPIPSGVEVAAKGSEVHVKGPKGELSEKIPEQIKVTVSESRVTFDAPRHSEHQACEWPR